MIAELDYTADDYPQRVLKLIGKYPHALNAPVVERILDIQMRAHCHHKGIDFPDEVKKESRTQEPSSPLETDNIAGKLEQPTSSLIERVYGKEPSNTQSDSSNELLKVAQEQAEEDELRRLKKQTKRAQADADMARLQAQQAQQDAMRARQDADMARDAAAREQRRGW